jgi:hypothetical protein
MSDPYAPRPYAALIVEPTNHWGLEYSILHTRSALTTNSKALWAVHVVHSNVNKVCLLCVCLSLSLSLSVCLCVCVCVCQNHPKKRIRRSFG